MRALNTQSGGGGGADAGKYGRWGVFNTEYTAAKTFSGNNWAAPYALTVAVQQIPLAERPNIAGFQFQLDLRYVESLLDGGLLLVDGSLRLLSASDRAKRILGAGMGLSDGGGTLMLGRSNAQRHLKSLIDGRLYPKDSEGATVSQVPPIVPVRDSEGDVRYVVSVLPSQFQLVETATMLFVGEVTDNTPLACEALVAVFGLSRREAEFAQLFSQGIQVDDIAARMGVSPNTARVHLRQILAKTGSTGQTDLARKMHRIRSAAAFNGRV